MVQNEENQHTRVIGSDAMMTGEARKKQKKVKGGEDLFINCSVNSSGVTVGHNSISGHTQKIYSHQEAIWSP